MSKVIAQVNEAMQTRPVLVLQLYTHAYANKPGDTPGFSAGVRGETDYLDGCELETVTQAEALELLHQYPRDLHLILDDDSVGCAQWLAAAQRWDANETNSIVEQAVNALQSGDFGSASAWVAMLALRSGCVPTCNLDDITDFAAKGDRIVLHINGANWIAQV